MCSIKEIIFELEKELLKSEIRKSQQRIREILDSEFVEFCSSGSEYHYKDGDVFQADDNNSELDWEILNFEIKKLSDDCVLTMFKLVKQNEINENKKYSLRSSIWKCNSGNWKMIFHQGTLSTRVNIDEN